MGGDRPLSGHRRSALGLATLREDGFASLSGSGSVFTSTLVCHGAALTVTADFGEGGWIRVGTIGKYGGSALGLANSKKLTLNATKTPLQFHGDADFSSLIGYKV